MGEAIRAFELKVLHVVTCDQASPFADTVASYANEVLPGVLLFVFTMLVLSLSRARRPRVVRVLVAGLLTLGVVHGIRAILWSAAPRPRPGQTFTEDQILRGVLNRGTCAQHPEMWVERDYPPKSPSFPSSHVVTVGAFAAAIGFGFCWLAIPAWLAALVVGWSRMYSGKHWPSDVLGSLVISALVGWLVWRSIPRLQALVGSRFPRLAPRPPVAQG